MKAKFGMIVVAGRGKIGGHVASANRSGAYFRTKVTPVNPQTTFQSVVRSRLGQLSQAWRGLSETQRAGWNGAVQDYAKTDIFGDLRNPSGINLFQKLNNNLLSVGGAIINDAPRPEAVDSQLLTDLIMDTVTPEYRVDLQGGVPAGMSIKIFATAPQSVGKSFVKSEYRQIAFFPTEGIGALDIETQYLAKFGTPAVGSKVFVKVVFVNMTTGQASPEQSISTIVV